MTFQGPKRAEDYSQTVVTDRISGGLQQMCLYDKNHQTEYGMKGDADDLFPQ